MTVMSIIGAVACLGAFAATFRRHKGLAALRRPQDIVGFRKVEVDGEVLVLWITMTDGTSYELPLGGKGHGDEALSALKALAPNAREEA